MLVKEEVKPEVNSGVNTTAKFTAWSKHCCRFYDALAELLVDRKYILAKDIVPLLPIFKCLPKKFHLKVKIWI